MNILNRYVSYIALAHDTSVSKLSLKNHLDRSYINTTLAVKSYTTTMKWVINKIILKDMNLDNNEKHFLKMLLNEKKNGQNNSNVNQKAIQFVLKNVVKKNPHYNFFWMYKKMNHMTTKQFAKTIGVSYAEGNRLLFVHSLRYLTLKKFANRLNVSYAKLSSYFNVTGSTSTTDQLGKKVHMIRTQYHIKEDVLASKLGTTQTVMSSLERYKHPNITPKFLLVLFKFSNYFDVSFIKLLSLSTRCQNLQKQNPALCRITYQDIGNLLDAYHHNQLDDDDFVQKVVNVFYVKANQQYAQLISNHKLIHFQNKYNLTANDWHYTAKYYQLHYRHFCRDMANILKVSVNNIHRYMNPNVNIHTQTKHRFLRALTKFQLQNA